MLNAYWRARRETDSDKRVKKAEFLEELKLCRVESDMGLLVLQALDDFYLELYIEKMKRAQKNG